MGLTLRVCLLPHFLMTLFSNTSRVEIGAITRGIHAETFLIVVHDSTQRICSNPHRKIAHTAMEYIRVDTHT